MRQRNENLRFIHLLPIMIALLVSFFVLSEPYSTSASHAHWTHNYYIHSRVYNEKVCVEAAGSSMSQSTARSRVNNTLKYDNPSSDWHGLASNRIFFEVNTIYCGNMTTSQLNDMKMRVYVKDYTGNICPNNANVSCVQQWSPVIHNGHYGHAYQIVYFKTSHINGSAAVYHHTIGHEFGHTIGLGDPSDRNGNDCNWTSIMHSIYYGCSTDYEWPTSSDRTNVTNTANHYTIPGD